MYEHETCAVLAFGIVLGREAIVLFNFGIVAFLVCLVCCGVYRILEMTSATCNQVVVGVGEQGCQLAVGVG